MTASGKHTNRKILVVEWQSGKTKIEKKEAFATRSNEMFSWPRLFFLAFLLALRFSIISFYFIVNRTNCCAIILHEIEQRNKRQQRRMKKKNVRVCSLQNPIIWLAFHDHNWLLWKSKYSQRRRRCLSHCHADEANKAKNENQVQC